MKTAVKSFSDLLPYCETRRNGRMITAASSIPVIASMIWTGICAMMANRPDSGDAWCCAGAGLAAICALIEARGKGRGVGQTISVFIISSVVGAVGPGIAVYYMMRWNWIDKDAAQLVLWQSWGAAGFFFGLNAWWIVHLVNRKFRRPFENAVDKIWPEVDTDTKSNH